MRKNFTLWVDGFNKCREKRLSVFKFYFSPPKGGLNLQCN